MACDPNTLLEQAKCLNACIPQGMMQATEVALLCQIANAGVGDQFVLKTGDSMTGTLAIDVGTQTVSPGNALSLSQVIDDGGSGLGNFSLLSLKIDDSSGNFVTANSLVLLDNTNTPQLTISAHGRITTGQVVICSSLEIYSNPFALTGLKFVISSGNQIGFYGASAVQQVSGADLTNNVTIGGVSDTIADFTSLTVYATDAAAIRNDIYQLARKLKQINDGLRSYGLFT